MFLKRILDIRHTLAFRLTLWYAAVFTVSSFVAFFVIYITVSSVIRSQRDQALLNDLAEFSSICGLKGADAMRSEMEIEAESDGVHKVFFRLLDPKGEEIDSSNMSSWKGVGIARSALKQVAARERHIFETLTLPGRPHKVRVLYGTIAPGNIMQIGQSLEDDARFLEAFRKVFGTSLGIIIVFSALIGLFMARHALSGVGEVTQTALNISKGAFQQRVRVKTKADEIERLASAFNRMLDRIQELVIGMKEMTDTIAHDLKTPITRIRGIAELGLDAGNPDDESQKLAADTIEECDYLVQMINTMLQISETESGIVRLEKERVDIAAIVQGALELFDPIAQEKGITLTSQVPDSITIPGDIHGLQRMIVNLLENAIKYTPSGGTVTTSLRDNNGHILLVVHDTGIGISETELPNIFKRLYRCDASRSQPGFGLGLSLALAVAQAHGGDITATSRPGEGSVFTVSIPRTRLSS